LIVFSSKLFVFSACLRFDVGEGGGGVFIFQ